MVQVVSCPWHRSPPKPLPELHSPPPGEPGLVGVRNRGQTLLAAPFLTYTESTAFADSDSFLTCFSSTVSCSLVSCSILTAITPNQLSTFLMWLCHPDPKSFSVVAEPSVTSLMNLPNHVLASWGGRPRPRHASAPPKALGLALAFPPFGAGGCCCGCCCGC